MKDNTKRNRIIGLLIGLIGLVALFYFRFDYRFGFTSMELKTPIGELIYEITRNMMSGSIKAEEDRALLFWAIFQIIYLAFVWYYRGCIGHWVIKVMRLGYKKL